MASPARGALNRETPPPPGTWRSYALEGVSEHLQEFEGLQVLDLGGLNQPNLDYVTGLGHRLYSEDLLRAYDTFFSAEELSLRLPTTDRIAEFLDQTFVHQAESCNGALVWDTLQFLPLATAEAVVERLYRILCVDAPLLAFFHRDVSGPVAPSICRVADSRHLSVQSKPGLRPIEQFPPRAIERLFGRFRAVKFYLTRENHQEVIARR